MSEIPRRAHIDRLTPAEAAIYNAIRIIEETLPADVRLTDAVVLLQAARESVADFVDCRSSMRRRLHSDDCPTCAEVIALVEKYEAVAITPWSQQMVAELKTDIVGLAMEVERRRMSEWQPIETAPKDKPLIYWTVQEYAPPDFIRPNRGSLHFGKFGSWSSLEKAVYWMPLPDPPRVEAAHE